MFEMAKNTPAATPDNPFLPAEQRTEFVTFRMTPTEKKALTEMAEDRKVDAVEVIRTALADSYAANPPKKKRK